MLEARRAERTPIRHTCSCVICGVTFTSRTALAKYCGQTCRNRGYQAARKADGRERALRERLAEHQARYRAEYARRHRTFLPCSVCGTVVERRQGARYDHGGRTACSLPCKQYLRNGAWPSSLVPDRHPIRSTPVPPDHPSRYKPRLARFSAGMCIRCGAWFIRDRMACDNLTSRCCSAVCNSRYHKSLRRVRKRGAYKARVSARYIYERDGWRCQLCRKKVDRRKMVPHPMAPTLDHIVPLAKGGTHEPANVWTAHYLCNCRKSAGGGGEQLMLFG